MAEANIFKRKSLDMLMAEASDTSEHGLKRALGPINLITLGIGAIIGAGIFVLTGEAAAQYTGPAIVLSYVLAGVACAFAGLCYAEFASMIPIAGSAYTYGYATLGEIIAWVIGWDLILEYAFGAATVASGWSSTLVAFLQDYGINIPPQICDVPGAKWAMFDGRWFPESALSMDQLAQATQHVTTSFNLVAFLAILAVTTILIVGIKESANFNTVVVFIKLFAVLTFIAVAGAFVFKHPDIARTNWATFLPANAGSFGSYGWSGVLRAAGVVFFAYIGFDAVSTAAQEAKNPQKDMPIGILGSLAICTVLYIVVSALLTMTVHYSRLNIGAPVSLAIRETGVRWGSYVVNAGALAGLSTVMLVMMLGQSRVFYSMAKDGLLWKWASDIHPKFRTPWKSTAIVGICVAFTGSLVPIGDLGQMVSIGTLMAFVIVCAGVLVMRKKRPDVNRPFRTPWVPFVPIMGMLVSFALMIGLNGKTWVRLVVWLIIGMIIYFGYGIKHSRVQRGEVVHVENPPSGDTYTASARKKP
ncbi:MAG: amino acid permease [Candidatus Koribacter versatilis]|uniref:Amino acid permease n=1 Tax=Candidatus Korobacter versatilis TaxID=658062 RepID=A0A932A8N5_9BACT|nr:amino acid permease [Candidatus Koribacter versatilis]